MRKLNLNKHAQSEMVGFVVIVAIVMIIAFIFLIIQIRKPVAELQSKEVENMISSVLQYTTNCVQEYVPNYDSMQDLIKDCYDLKKCTNLERMSCDYLNESILGVMAGVKKTEASIIGYKMDIYHQNKDDEQKDSIIRITEGNLSAVKTKGSQQLISTPEGRIVVKLNLYYDS